MDADDFLREAAEKAQQTFEAGRTVLSFSEYLQAAFEAPASFARTAPQLLRDAMRHAGESQQHRPVGSVTRRAIFDATLQGAKGVVAGQEQVVDEILQSLETFARQGRVDRLILLHGPNGSAKSSIVAAMMRSLEAYSLTQEGAVYRFAWVFPTDKIVKGRVGFGGRGPAATAGGKVGGGFGAAGSWESYAHLPPDAVEARLGCDLKDHPLRLLPVTERQAVFDAAQQEDPSFVPGDALARGGLCRTCQTIFDALMTAYEGDLARVLAHVQVERFSFSRRYLRGAVTIEPQVSVDAGVRALALDRSASALPPALQTVNLLNASGPLVDGNRGIVEYADLLKRPLEAFKYLLGTSETGEVRMEHLLLELDAILIASTNEMHLSAFKEVPDFSSFKGRMLLIQVPYLRRVSDEKAIYKQRLMDAAAGRHIAPHALELVARWAVLSRLSRPRSSNFPEAVRELIASLQPLDKMRLYEHGAVPDRCSLEEGDALRAQIEALYHEADLEPVYEGLLGASPREIITILQEAAQEQSRACVEVPTLIEGLQTLVQETNVYAFLNVEADQGYREYGAFIEQVRELWLDEVEEEVRAALGLVAERQYQDRFARYIVNVSSWLKGVQVRNYLSGQLEAPDERLMQELESIFLSSEETPKVFRQGLISKIGAWRLEHPLDAEQEAAAAADAEGGGLDFTQIFPKLYRKLKERFNADQHAELRRVQENVFQVLDPEDRGRGLGDKARTRVETMMETLRSEHGYCDDCASTAVLALLRARYS